MSSSTKAAAHTTDTDPSPEAEAPELPARAAVRRHLLARLDAAGLARPRSLSPDDFAATRKRLVDRLAYLTPARLDLLAEAVIRIATGPARCTWPAEATVLNLAFDIARPPPRDDAIVGSWLRSRAGAEAREGGWHVQLFRHITRTRLPVKGFELERIRAEAEDDRRERARLRRERDEGTIAPAGLAWLEAFAADETAALDLIAEGEAARAAKAEAGA